MRFVLCVVLLATTSLLPSIVVAQTAAQSGNARSTSYSTTVESLPLPPSNPGDPDKAISGPSASPFRYFGKIVGNAAGSPTNGYTTVFDLSQVQLDTLITAGHNQSTSEAAGRTMIPQISSYIMMRGQGDASNFDCGGYVGNSTPTRSTNWLADPALTCIAGELDAISDSVNIVASELTVRDNGHAATMSGYNSHIFRSVLPNPNPKQYVAVNFAATSNGKAPVDAFYVGSGKSKVGMDFTKASLSLPGAAFTTSADQYWFMNATNSSPVDTPDRISPGNTYLGYSANTRGIVGVVDGINSLSLRSYGVYVTDVPLDVQTSIVVGPAKISTEQGELGLSKVSLSGAAPGEGGLKISAVAGTRPGTCKLVVYAGKSTTPSTILDNIGSGC